MVYGLWSMVYVAPKESCLRARAPLCGGPAVRGRRAAPERFQDLHRFGVSKMTFTDTHSCSSREPPQPPAG